MLKVLNEQTLSTHQEIRQRFPNCQYIYTVDSVKDFDSGSGYLYCVSTSPRSQREMILEGDKLLDAGGRIPIVSGSYNNGGTPGVQAIVK